MEDLDLSIAGQIAKSALTNAEQDKAIYKNAGKISAQKENIATLQTAVNSLSSGVSDSADGVQITFARGFEYNGAPALDLNGTALFVGSANPALTLGGTPITVLHKGNIPNSPNQQVIARLPGNLMAVLTH